MADNKHYPSHRNKKERNNIQVQTFGVAAFDESFIKGIQSMEHSSKSNPQAPKVGKGEIKGPNPFGTTPSLRESASKKGNT